jgi:hypothetical protein
MAVPIRHVPIRIAATALDIPVAMRDIPGRSAKVEYPYTRHFPMHSVNWPLRTGRDRRLVEDRPTGDV